MKGRLLILLFAGASLCQAEELDARPLVRVGDSASAVRSALGEPRMEFPLRGECILEYENCIITSSNGVVVAIKKRNPKKKVKTDSRPTVGVVLGKARNGDAEAQFLLGYCYQIGKTVEKNMDEAIRWYTLAAMQGHVSAQHNLGVIYMQGMGVDRDYEQAYIWAWLAAQKGDDELKNSLRSHITGEQETAARAHALRIRQGLEQPPYGTPSASATPIVRQDKPTSAAGNKAD